MLREPVILKPDVAPKFVSSNGQIACYKPCTIPLPRRPWYEIVGLILLSILWPFAAMYIDGASPTSVLGNLILWLFVPIPAIVWGILYVLRSKEHRDVSNPMRNTLWTPEKHAKALDKLKKKPSKSAKEKPRETKTDGLQKGVTLPLQELETPAKAEVAPLEKADPSPSELEAGPSKEPPKQEKEIKSKKMLV